MSTFEQNRVVVAILAAGTASRFGTTKQLVTFEGATLVGRAVAIANAAAGRRVALVVGHDWRAVADACEPLDGFLLINDDYANGLGTSVAAATRALRHAADALLITLADQPRVTAEHLRTIVESWSGDPNAIIATRFGRSTGVPALFGSACFDALAALEGDRGARDLIRSGRYPVTEIEFPDAAIDIDRPEDLESV